MSEIPEHIMDMAHGLIESWVDTFGIMPEEEFEIAEAIAQALLAAEKRGKEEERERCARIAEGNSAEFDFGKALAECRDSEHGFHSGRLHAAAAIRGS